VFSIDTYIRVIKRTSAFVLGVFVPVLRFFWPVILRRRGDGLKYYVYVFA